MYLISDNFTLTFLGLTYQEAAYDVDHVVVIVVDSDAVHGQSAVMIVLNAAFVAHRAMMHPWQLVNATFLAVSKLAGVPTSILFELLQDFQGREVIFVDDLLGQAFKVRLKSVTQLLLPLQHLLKLVELKTHFTICSTTIYKREREREIEEFQILSQEITH